MNSLLLLYKTGINNTYTSKMRQRESVTSVTPLSSENYDQNKFKTIYHRIKKCRKIRDSRFWA